MQRQPFSTVSISHRLPAAASLISRYSLPARAFSSSRLRIISTDSVDPFFNLAFEECLLAEHIQAAQQQRDVSLGLCNTACSPSTRTLFLWRNGPSVILGRHQNPYRELHMDRVADSAVNLVRRKSGGGTVYQDLGNSIFSFLQPEAEAPKEFNNGILLRALDRIGVVAEASGRNDLILPDQRKISGHAFQREKGILLHHGTLLIDVDFGRLQALLNPNKLKLQAKGVASVAARVANIKELRPSIDHHAWGQTLADEFVRSHAAALSAPVRHTVTEAALIDSPLLRQSYEALKSWNWRFGSTPAFSHEFEHRFSWGLVTLQLSVKDSGLRIESAKLFSDALNTRMIEELEAALNSGGIVYDRESMASAAAEAVRRIELTIGSEAKDCAVQFHDWIKQLSL